MKAFFKKSNCRLKNCKKVLIFIALYRIFQIVNPSLHNRVVVCLETGRPH